MSPEAPLRAAVRSWFAASLLAIRHDDLDALGGVTLSAITDEQLKAWRKRGEQLWKRVAECEARMRALAGR